MNLSTVKWAQCDKTQQRTDQDIHENEDIRCREKAKFHYAIHSQTRSPTWTQTCVCVSCACPRPVESWSKASCEPVCDQV